MELLVVFLPFFSFFSLFFFGRFVGSQYSCFYSTILLLISFCLSVFIFFSVNFFYPRTINFQFFVWFSSSFCVVWGLMCDPLTYVMFIVVLAISFCVHLYSLSYMRMDPHIVRFFSFLSLFTFFMLVLVSSSNLVQLFIGWEGVGVCSYLLISFWFTRSQAIKSALKAIVINRIGDFGLVVAMALIYLFVGSLDFTVLSVLSGSLINYYVSFGFFSCKFVDLVTFFLLLGAVGKSAQLGLHTWLPDAIEGPTPVSALIHAATMVTAGVFLIVRMSFLFEQSFNVLVLMSLVGVLTSLFAATVGLVQNDVKKIIAYSTCSQLGYMILSCGYSSYNFAIFHLFNHAFFKALLFLGAGVVIHAFSDEQDMRRIGGVVRLLPFSYSSMLIGTMALLGFPFLSGFYSKEAIIEVVSVSCSSLSFFISWLAVVVAFLTSFYGFRLVYLVFFSVPVSGRFFYVNVGDHDSDFFMLVPLFILSLASLFSGYLAYECFVGMGSDFWGASIFVIPGYSISSSVEFLSSWVKIFPLFLSMLGVFLVVFFYWFYNSFFSFFFCFRSWFVSFLLFKRWFFDFIYNFFITFPVLYFGYFISFRLLDRGILEYVGPTGGSILCSTWGRSVCGVQSGYLHHYFFIMVGTLMWVLFLVIFGFCLRKFFLLLFLVIWFVRKSFEEKENNETVLL